MTTHIQENNNQLIASFSGRLDTAASVQTAEDVKPLLEAMDKEIILDCSELEYISSSGLRIFLGIRKDAAKNGSRVIVRNINTDIRQVFMMTGFISLFEIQ
ncbi:MAG: STAS domain-containing protein [Bacteroidales bacterium]|jgi:anti-sigma B factor antagonist|nr:STAS domain-containing protein [Bacteroidales bacterium]MBR3571855.1 STAS domain-containing protein [Bacteroidales bacterium]